MKQEEIEFWADWDATYPGRPHAEATPLDVDVWRAAKDKPPDDALNATTPVSETEVEGRGENLTSYTQTSTVPTAVKTTSPQDSTDAIVEPPAPPVVPEPPAPPAVHETLKLHVNVFAGLTSVDYGAGDPTWEQFVPWATKPFICNNKSDAPLFNLVDFGGRPRKKENVISVHGFVGDIEHIDAKRAAEIVALFEPLAAVITTTFSSKHNEPNGEVRLRAIAPYPEPATPEQHDKVWAFMASQIPELDPKCREPAHFYHVCSHAPGCDGVVVVCNGAPIDVNKVLKLVPQAPANNQTTPAKPVHEVAEGRFKRVVQGLAKSSKPTAAAFERLLKGVPYAVPGERDNTLFQMVSELAAEMPTADPQSVARHFASSLSFMALEAGGAPTEADVAYKFTRAVQALGGSTDEVELLRSANNSPIANETNVFSVLEGDPEVKDAFAYNEFAAVVTVMHGVPWDKNANKRALADGDITHFTAWVCKKYRLNVKQNMVLTCIAAEAKKHAYHPVREYLTGLAWDRTPRLDTWLHDHTGCEDTPYTRKVSAWFLMQMVKRAIEPGCQADYALLLVGRQGAGKSTLAKRLATEPWFTDDAGQIGSKDACMNLAGRWVVELAELSSVRKADTESVKAYITRQTDKFRLPYGKLVGEFPRGCCFIGSTNDPMPLADRTGNRRYWPVRVADKPLDVEAFDAVRDQLFAEAKHRVALGERAYPSDAELAEFAAEASKFEGADSWDDKLANWLDCPHGFTSETPLTLAYAMSSIFGLDRPTSSDEKHAQDCLRKAGFTYTGHRTRKTHDGKQRYVWEPPKGWAPPAVVSRSGPFSAPPRLAVA